MHRKITWSQVSLFVFAALSALACLPQLNTGFSSLDDGFYAYAAAAVLDGKTIHRDFFSQYIGYQHYLHAAFFYFFGEDYYILRYPLVLTQCLANVSSVIIFRKAGWAYQLTAILIATGFGVLLFKNPSTSWTCVALTLAVIAVASSQSMKARVTPQSLLMGVLLGIMFGIRHPTAIFIGMGVFVYVVISSDARTIKSRWEPTSKFLVVGGLLIALAALLIYMRKASTLADMLPWFVAPITYLGYALSQIKSKNCLLAISKLAWIATGFVVAISPWLVSTTISGTWEAMMVDLRTMPADYSAMLNLTTADYAGNLIFVFQHLLDAKSAAGLAISLIALLYPTIIASCILISNRNPALRQWIDSPASIIASFHVLVIIAVITIVYSAYIIAIEFISLLVLSSRLENLILRRLLVTTFATLSLVTFFALSNQFEAKTGVAYFGGGERPLSKCWLPRCSLLTIASNNKVASQAYDALDKLKTPVSTVVSLPWGYHYEFSYPSKFTPPYPDTRLPLYRGVPARTAYEQIMQAEDPIILLEKFAARDESIYPEFQDYFARDFLKAYDSPAFMILIKKDRTVRQ